MSGCARKDARKGKLADLTFLEAMHMYVVFKARVRDDALHVLQSLCDWFFVLLHGHTGKGGLSDVWVGECVAVVMGTDGHRVLGDDRKVDESINSCFKPIEIWRGTRFLIRGR